MAQGGDAIRGVAVVGDADEERDAAQGGVPREEGEQVPPQRCVGVGGGGEVEDDGGGGEGAQDLAPIPARRVWAS